MIGEKIRQTRLAQQRSLADVARQARVSIATLSRIENGKQTLDIALFLVLARVLEQQPHELLVETEGAPHGDGLDPLVRKISAFEAKQRAQLWKELAAAQRAQRTLARRAKAESLAQQVEELLAHLECMREELESVRKRLGRAGTARTR
jgi:transcriptional regulator with XRE-family HTH domain